MKTNECQRRSLMVALLTVMSAAALGADVDGPPSAAAPGSAVFYDSLAVNFGLHGYTGALAPVRVRSPAIAYQSLAYGPAIHSYPQVGAEWETAWNLTYVSPANGQAIYGYPAAGAEPDQTGRLPSIVIE